LSILLEALRKSEKGQRQVEAPTIHSEQHIAAVSDQVNKGSLAVLLLAAMLLIAWIVWHQYEPSTTRYQPTAASLAKKDGATTPAPSSMQVVDSATDSGISAADDTTGAAGKQQRTPVENFQQSAPDSAKPKTNKAKTTRRIKVKPKPKPKPQVADAGVSRVRATPPEKSDNSARSDDMRPQPISYWELPDAVRTDVPVMKFSVLVYAGEPADRFVLINGQRLGEGDSFQQGLVVEEIRRDGVVFSYRLYKFLIER